MKNSLQRLLPTVFTVLALAASTFGAPAIATQPASTNWTLGQTGTLTVAATGTDPLSYQWRKFGTPIPGATSATLAVPNVTLADAGLYDVVITAGPATLTSAAAQINPVPAKYPGHLRPKSGFNPSFESDSPSTFTVATPNGGFYTLGWFTRLNGLPSNGVVRFLASGALDPAYTAVSVSGPIASAALQSDGKLLIAGYFTVVGGVNRKYLARLNADGTLDASFDAGTVLTGAPSTMMLQPDGKIVFAGGFSPDNGVTTGRAARLNSDGTLDQVFVAALGTGFNNSVRAIGLQPDGKIVLGGYFSTFNGTAVRDLVRLNADGTLDSAFAAATGTGFAGNVYALVLDGSGRIIVGGGFSDYNSTGRANLLRLKADGTLDSTFLPTNNGPSGAVMQLAIDASGRILVAGFLYTYDRLSVPNLIRVSPVDGARDTAFTSAYSPFAFTLLADGKLIADGTVRLTADGARDPAYAPSFRGPGSVTAFLPLAHGQWLVGGNFAYVNGAPLKNLVRLNADGSTDTTYAGNGGSGNYSVSNLLAAPDGKVYVGLTNSALTRLNADGTKDLTFDPHGYGGLSPDLALQADGKLLIGTRNAGHSPLVRLNQDGTYDSAFTNAIGASLNFNVYLTWAQADGTILVAGASPTYSGIGAPGLIRFKADGTVDPTFLAGNDLIGSFSTLALGLDGRIWASGTYKIGSGDYHSTLLSFHADGTVDSTFTPPSVDKIPLGVLAQADGKILEYGNFTTYNGVASHGFIRTNADGTVDPSFGVPTSLYTEPVYNGPMMYLVDGSLMVSGSRFDFTDGVHTGLVLLEPSLAVIAAQPVSQTATAGGDASFSVTATGENLTYQWYKDSALIPGATGTSYVASAVTAASSGVYTVQITSSGGTVISAAATLTVNVPPTPGHLANLSTRTAIGTGDNVLIVGFVISGAYPKPVLLRGVGGATLALQKVSGPLPDPVLDLYHGSVIGHNDNWGTAGNPADIAAVADRVGAFALPSGSGDSVLSLSLQPGIYSAILYGGGTANTGIGLLEIYDTQDGLTASSPRLVNLSSRGQVGTGDKLMIAGFVVTGDQARTILIRGVGPTLASQGVAKDSVLNDPAIYLYKGSDVIGQNDNWGSAGDSAALIATANATGAFPLPEGSKDAAMLVTLQPGVYSVIVAGTGGTTGIALVELYEVQ